MRVRLRASGHSAHAPLYHSDTSVQPGKGPTSSDRTGEFRLKPGTVRIAFVPAVPYEAIADKTPEELREHMRGFIEALAGS